MFVEWHSSLDAQGRMFIPPAYRGDVTVLLRFVRRGLISGIGPDKSTYIPEEVTEVAVDKRGRITVPTPLRRCSGIERAVVLDPGYVLARNLIKTIDRIEGK